MAVELNVEYTRTSEYRFLPENIDVRPNLNGRHEKPDVEWLIADILKHGQHTPCPFWSDAGTPVLAAGFSRWRAISEINKRKLTLKPLELRCTYIKCNEQGAFIRNISENRMRNPTSPIDDAHNISQLVEAWQMNLEEVAKVYFPVADTKDEIKEAVKWVNSRLELVKLTPEAEKAMRTGRLNETAAQAIAKLSSTQQREVLKKDGKLTAKDIKGSKPKKLKRAASPVAIPVELKRRITAVLESCDWEASSSGSVWVEVRKEELKAVQDYIEEK